MKSFRHRLADFTAGIGLTLGDASHFTLRVSKRIRPEPHVGERTNAWIDGTSGTNATAVKVRRRP